MPALPVLLLVTSFYFTRKIEANREPLSYVSISRCIYLSTSHLPSFFPFALGSSSTWALGSTPPTFPGTDHYPSQQLLNLLKPLINKIKDWIHRIAGVSSSRYSRAITGQSWSHRPWFATHCAGQL